MKIIKPGCIGSLDFHFLLLLQGDAQPLPVAPPRTTIIDGNSNQRLRCLPNFFLGRLLLSPQVSGSRDANRTTSPAESTIKPKGKGSLPLPSSPCAYPLFRLLEQASPLSLWFLWFWGAVERRLLSVLWSTGWSGRRCPRPRRPVPPPPPPLRRPHRHAAAGSGPIYST
jgi:hypothetical protein